MYVVSVTVVPAVPIVSVVRATGTALLSMYVRVSVPAPIQPVYETVFASAPLVFVSDLIVVSCAWATSPRVNTAAVMVNAILISSSCRVVVHDVGQLFPDTPELGVV